MMRFLDPADDRDYESTLAFTNSDAESPVSVPDSEEFKLWTQCGGEEHHEIYISANIIAAGVVATEDWHTT